MYHAFIQTLYTCNPGIYTNPNTASNIIGPIFQVRRSRGREIRIVACVTANNSKSLGSVYRQMFLGIVSSSHFSFVFCRKRYSKFLC